MTDPKNTNYAKIKVLGFDIELKNGHSGFARAYLMKSGKRTGQFADFRDNIDISDQVEELHQAQLSAKASDDWTKRSSDATALYERFKQGEADEMAVKVKASEAAASLALQLFLSKNLPTDSQPMKMPQEFAGKKELEDGFKMGFEDAFHNLYTDGKQKLTYADLDANNKKKYLGLSR